MFDEMCLDFNSLSDRPHLKPPIHPVREKELWTDTINADPLMTITPEMPNLSNSVWAQSTLSSTIDMNSWTYTTAGGAGGSQLNMYDSPPYHSQYPPDRTLDSGKKANPPSLHTAYNEVISPRLCCCNCHKAAGFGSHREERDSDQPSTHTENSINVNVNPAPQDKIHQNSANSILDTTATPGTPSSSNSKEKFEHRLFSLSTALGATLSETVIEVQEGFHCGLPNCTNPLKVFPTSDAVIEHIREDDISVKPFWCTCNTQFTTKAIGTRHVDGETYGYRYTCSICPRRYKRADQLRSHMKLKHPSVRMTKENLKRLFKRNT